MLNKDKTIDKALTNHDLIFPIAGKQSLEECFFNHHGKMLFKYQTNDDEVHTIKAVVTHEPPRPSTDNRNLFTVIVHNMNKPIEIKNLFIKHS